MLSAGSVDRMNSSRKTARRLGLVLQVILVVRSTSGILLTLIVSAGLLLGAACPGSSLNQVCAAESAPQLPSRLSAMDLVAENEFLALYVDMSTTEIAVWDKSHACVWYSNPVDRDTAEKVARGAAKDALGSQLTIKYDPNEILKDNYNFSIKSGQYTISQREDGIRIDYTFVEEWSDEDYVPLLVSQARFDERVLSRLSESDRKQILDRYTLVSLVEATDATKLVLPGIDADAIFGPYTVSPFDPNLATHLLTTIRENRRDYRLLSDVKLSDLENLIDNPTYILNPKTAPYIQRRLGAIIRTTGYDPFDVSADHESNHVDSPIESLEVFKVPLEYRLDGRSLIVRIPVSEVEYPIDVLDHEGLRHTFPVLSIRLLECFGAAGIDQDGYIFVPDGSGALIALNSGKVGQPSYQGVVYGRDNTLFPREVLNMETRAQYLEQVFLPVFGMKQGDRAFFAIIEDGDAMATICADVSGRSRSYNTVYAEFTTTPKGRFSFASIHEIDLYRTEIFQGDLQVRYSFLYGADANYSGMARYYQNYLIQNHEMQRSKPHNDVPLFLEVIGAITRSRPILGVSVNVTDPLTTYPEAGELVEDFLDRGVQSIKLRYTGWLKGGVKQRYPSSVVLERCLGGKSAFVQLVDWLEEKGIELYPNVAFLNVFRDSVFDGFSAQSGASRMLTRQVARNEELGSYILSPSKLGSLVDGFLASYRSYGIPGISLADMGKEANSDFRFDEQLVDRQKAARTIEEQVRKMSREARLNVMADGPNARVLPYLDSVVNMPGGSNWYNILDESVPFLQMVCRGYIDYAGEPMNLAEDRTDSLLRMIETGSCPYLVVAYGDSSLVKETEFDHLYSLNYRDWIDEAVEAYRQVNQALGCVQGQRIVGHEKVADSVFETSYESGVSVIVNYRAADVVVEGHVVPARGFLLVERGDLHED